MLYTTKEQQIGSDRDPNGEGWASRRFLLAKDGPPFSFVETEVAAGTGLQLYYQNLSETVYCVRGRAEVEHNNEGRVPDIHSASFLRGPYRQPPHAAHPDRSHLRLFLRTAPEGPGRGRLN